MAVSGKRAGDVVKSGSDIENKLCEACQDEDITTCADGVCKECKEYMCATCFQHHKKARQCRNHVLVDLDSTLVLDRNETCGQHDNEVIKYFCRNHELVGCRDCMILEHGECKPVLIEKFSKNFEENEDFKNMVQRLWHLESVVKYHIDNLNIKKKTRKTLRERALEEIREYRTTVIKICDEAEDIFRDEVNHLTSEHVELLDMFGKDLKALSSEIKRVKQQLSTESYRGKALFIRFIDKGPKIIEMEETLEQLKLKYNVNGFKFQKNEEPLDFLISNENFDTLKMMLESDELELEDCMEVLSDNEEVEMENVLKLRKENGPVCIGARVRPLSDCILGRIVKYGNQAHNQEPGTVTDIEYDDIIVVQWDFSGQVKYGYRIGKSKVGNGIELV